ncbi:hypothetical protein GCK72_007097 [Caenorhabditis remanei]|uniref:Uncharacterized protein n=1 Tax=Caenorhabditis remanei TaxID=31234 RepID=A0A6A5HH30_CAERE|nr:hypothetical protein GCK72_007097 [Caenorhabditis remanei]KAF1767138.1 hypothetical protein GCK72_007097 [Caenorhabditis remanei]
MKSLLISLLLLAPAVMCDPRSPWKIHLDTVNRQRSKFAEKYQVANMNELTYDPKLEKKILEQLAFTDTCPKPSIISHNGFDFYFDIGNVDEGKSTVYDLISAVGKKTMTSYISTCMKTGVRIISAVTDSSDTPAISGPPTSQCPDGSFPSSDFGGLCKLKKNRKGYVRKDVFDDFAKWICVPKKGFRCY